MLTGMTRHYLSQHEIAEQLGVSVTSIKKRYGNMPPPDVTVGQKAVQGWSQKTIDKWVAQRAALAKARTSQG